MPLWGSSDAASNSTIFAAAQLNKTPNTANRTALFGNTTANAYIAGVTVGQFGVNSNEIAAEGGKAAHTGWVLRTTGQGGRAGRVMQEVLVAGGITTDASDDSVYPDYTLRIVTQPSNASANSSDDEQATFSVVGASTPSGATLGYLWQYTTEAGNTETWATTASVSGFSDETTDTLTVDANTISDGTLVRVLVSATGAANVISSSAELTVTS